MPTIGTLFSGGGFADIGFTQAGYTPLWGVEYDNKIAAVYANNLGNHIINADVCNVDYAALARVDHIHASPVCKNASQANVDATESDIDIATAMATCRAIEARQPNTFSLENVWGYRDFEAFKRILDCLKRSGYTYEYWHLNSANYGVPQTRRRLILTARKNGRVFRPGATHTGKDGNGQVSMFEPLKPWVGWYEAIEDLIPTLPASEFAPWQVERLPTHPTAHFVADNGRGFLKVDKTIPSRNANEPFQTITIENANRWKSFIVDGQSNDHGASLTLREDEQPMYTRTSSMDKRPARAFLVSGDNAGRDLTIRDNYEPAYTMCGGSNRGRAWLQQGRVVKMTPRALARFQSLPDWYVLPDSNSLACTIIGNGVPCELARHVGLSLL